VKATDIGGRSVRFKAEVDFDGREITRYYLEQQDLEKMLQVSGSQFVQYEYRCTTEDSLLLFGQHEVNNVSIYICASSVRTKMSLAGA